MDAILLAALAAVLTLAFVESAAVPLPMMVVLAPAVYRFPESALWFALVATVGSACGAVGGSALGRWRGRCAVRRLVSAERFAWSERVYRNHGSFGLFLGAIIPFPYAPFTITTGIYETGYGHVFLVTALAKAGKYLVVVVGVRWLTGFDATVAFAVLGGVLVTGYVLWIGILRDKVVGRLAPPQSGDSRRDS